MAEVVVNSMWSDNYIPGRALRVTRLYPHLPFADVEVTSDPVMRARDHRGNPLPNSAAPYMIVMRTSEFGRRGSMGYTPLGMG